MSDWDKFGFFFLVANIICATFGKEMPWRIFNGAVSVGLAFSMIGNPLT